MSASTAKQQQPGSRKGIDVEQLDKPQMTTIAGRPIKVLNKPQSDILIACHTADGEDVHVPLLDLADALMKILVSRVRAITGTRL